MRNLKRLTIILLTILLCLSLTSVTVYGGSEGGSEGGSGGGDGWKNVDQFDGKSDASLDSATQDIVGAIISVIRIVGTGISIIMLVAVAIKYMSSAPGDRAEIKKHAVIYVVGAIVLFGGTQLIGIIQKFAGNIKA